MIRLITQKIADLLVDNNILIKDLSFEASPECYYPISLTLEGNFDEQSARQLLELLYPHNTEESEVNNSTQNDESSVSWEDMMKAIKEDYGN